jgi:transposase
MADADADYAVLVGLDWADKKHDLACLLVEDGKRQYLGIGSSPESIREWLAGIQSRFPGKRIAVCLEQSRGAVSYALASYGFVDLYPVNPVTMKNYRRAFSPSGAKDDPSDAALLLELLTHHRDALTKVTPDTEQTRKLQHLCELRRKAVGHRTALTNELVSTLKKYYPQALTLIADDRHSEMTCALLMKWPRFESIARVKPQALRKFYYAHHCRSEKRLQERLELIVSGCALTTDPAVVEPLVLQVQQLVSQIRVLNKSVAVYDRHISEVFAEHPDAAIFRTFPGAGQQLSARLLAAFGTDRGRYHAAVQISTYSGVAPVIERSGERKWVHWRWHCPKFLRQSFVEYAAKSIGQCEWAALYYRKQLERGKRHNAALRALAYKWQRIMFRCWQDGRPYDEQLYLQALAKHGSWLTKELANAA